MSLSLYTRGAIWASENKNTSHFELYFCEYSLLIIAILALVDTIQSETILYLNFNNWLVKIILVDLWIAWREAQKSCTNESRFLRTIAQGEKKSPFGRVFSLSTHDNKKQNVSGRASVVIVVFIHKTDRCIFINQVINLK